MADAALGRPLTRPAEGSRADKRWAQILDAAVARFAREGFHGASMASIAEEAGMSVGQIYRHFANKEAIIAAIVERDADETAAHCASLQVEPDALVESIVTDLEAAMNGESLQGGAPLRLEVLAEAARNPRMAALVQGADARLRAAARQAFTHTLGGRADPQSIESRLDIIAMLFDGAASRSIKNPNTNTRATAEALKPLLRLLFEG
ncbi:MAG: TetR/AcrR family transcriptional regulator [Alphaproteobacteria bacterium]|nr:TetR/AcrR family transcriptional regulator [Alphaproteobacteria bacterium]